MKRTDVYTGGNNAIDLRAIIYQEYLDKTQTEGLKNKTMNAFAITMFYFGIIILILFIVANTFRISPTFAEYEKSYNVSGYNIPHFLFDNMIISCKENNAKDLSHCVRTGVSIAYAESTWGHKFNYFGLTSQDKSINSWTSRYVKYWHTGTSGEFFYGANGKPGRSHYCLSEESSGTNGWCPNGQRNFNSIYFNKDIINFINKKTR